MAAKKKRRTLGGKSKRAGAAKKSGARKSAKRAQPRIACVIELGVANEGKICARVLPST